MHQFSPLDLAGLVTVAWVFLKVLGPPARALAKRLEGSASGIPASDPAVPQIQEELAQLEERVDFLERVLAAQKPAGELPRERTPI